MGTVASIVHNFGKLPGIIEKLQSDGAQLTEQITIVENIQSSLPQSSAPAAKLQAVLNKNAGYQCLRQIAVVLNGTQRIFQDARNCLQQK